MTSLLFAEPSQFDAPFLERLLPFLPPEKQEGLKKISHARARRESLLGWALLLFAWQRRFPGEPLPPLAFSESGKPRFSGDPFFFNLSHTDTLVCLVLSETGEIGADAQTLKAPSDALVRRVLTPAEQAVFAASEEKALCFTRFWTLKEALVKQTGEGLSRGLDTLDFAPFATQDRFSAFGLQFASETVGSAAVSYCAAQLSPRVTEQFVTQREMECLIRN